MKYDLKLQYRIQKVLYIIDFLIVFNQLPDFPTRLNSRILKPNLS